MILILVVVQDTSNIMKIALILSTEVYYQFSSCIQAKLQQKFIEGRHP